MLYQKFMSQGDSRIGQRLSSFQGGKWVQILLTHPKANPQGLAFFIGELHTYRIIPLKCLQNTHFQQYLVLSF